MMHVMTILSAALLLDINNANAASPRMTPFLPAETLRQNLNSSDQTKFVSGLSYVGGIADYLIEEKQICPPPGATVAQAAVLVRDDLNRDTHKYLHMSAAVPTRFVLRMAWRCKNNAK